MPRKPTILALLLIGLASAALAARPADRQEAAAEEPLLELMEGMKTHLKGTAMALRDESKRDDALKHVAELPEEKRAEHRTAFRRDLAETLKVLLDMEIHILDGKNAEAMQLVAKDLYTMRESAHGKYQKTEGR